MANHQNQRSTVAQEHALHLQRVLDEVYASRSWKITAPLRWGSDRVRRLVRALGRAGIRAVRLVPERLRAPARHQVINLARRFGFDEPLRAFATSYLNSPASTPQEAPVAEVTASPSAPVLHLSARGARIHAAIQSEYHKQLQTSDANRY